MRKGEILEKRNTSVEDGGRTCTPCGGIRDEAIADGAHRSEQPCAAEPSSERPRRVRPCLVTRQPSRWSPTRQAGRNWRAVASDKKSRSSSRLRNGSRVGGPRTASTSARTAVRGVGAPPRLAASRRAVRTGRDSWGGTSRQPAQQAARRAGRGCVIPRDRSSLRHRLSSLGPYERQGGSAGSCSFRWPAAWCWGGPTRPPALTRNDLPHGLWNLSTFLPP